MAFDDRSYSGNAVPTTLAANITNIATTLTSLLSTGYPDGTSGPFFIQLGSETIKCSSRSGLTFTVQTVPVSGRGWDGTTAASHIVGETINHVYTATDADEANQHISNPALDHHTNYLTTGRHDTSLRHGIGTLPTGGTPSNSLVGDTAQTGTANYLSLSDHKHARESFGVPVSAGVANGAGVLTTVPRADHVHAGGVPILTSGTRPASPVTGQTIVESNTHRIVGYAAGTWRRIGSLSVAGRTGSYVARLGTYSIPDGGPTSYVIPWDTELFDSDGFMPTPDGTTTYTITCPNVEASGVFLVTFHVAWGTLFVPRSYMEIYHGFSGGGYNQHRLSTTGEDRGTLTISLEVANGDTIQGGVWQNSGGPVDVNGFIQAYRLFA